MSKYKRNLVISTRTDIRLIAGLVNFYKSKELLARTKSSLVGDSIEDFVLILSDKGMTNIPKTYREAMSILTNNNFTFTDKDGRITQREVVHMLADEEIDINRAELDIDPSIAKKVVDNI